MAALCWWRQRRLENKFFLSLPILTLLAMAASMARWHRSLPACLDYEVRVSRVCRRGGDGFPMHFGPPVRGLRCRCEDLTFFGGWALESVDLPATMALTVSSPGCWSNRGLDDFPSAINNDRLAPAMERQRRRGHRPARDEEDDRPPETSIYFIYFLCRGAGCLYCLFDR